MGRALSSDAPARCARLLRSGGMIRTYVAVVDGCRDAQREGGRISVYEMEKAAEWALAELRATILARRLLVPVRWCRE